MKQAPVRLYASFHGNRRQQKALRALTERYGLHRRRLTDFTELDKILYQNIKKMASNV